MNFTAVRAGIFTFWPGLRGFTPVRAARLEVEKVPKPRNATRSPLAMASVRRPRNSSVTFCACTPVSSARAASSFANSLLFMR